MKFIHEDPPRTRARAAVTILLSVIFIAALAFWIYCVRTGDPARAWRAMLIAFIYFVPLSAGLVVWSAISLASRGSWQFKAERITFFGLGFAVPSVIMLAALWISSPDWAIWLNKDLPQRAWLRGPFLFSRDMLALAAFWILAFAYVRARQAGHGHKLAPFLIVVYTLVFSLLGYDLVMTLDPTWFSTLFGIYFFITGVYLSLCAWAFICAMTRAEQPLLHDLGKLVVAFSLLSTYLMFAHLLIIWYENMPRETHYLVPRMNVPAWKNIGYFLVASIYLGPLIMLLTIWSKRTWWFLSAVSFLLMCGLVVERWWLVAPQFDAAASFGAPEISIFVSILALWILMMWRESNRLCSVSVEGK